MSLLRMQIKREINAIQRVIKLHNFIVPAIYRNYFKKSGFIFNTNDLKEKIHVSFLYLYLCSYTVFNIFSKKQELFFVTVYDKD